MKRNLKIVLIKEVDFMRAWIRLLEHCIRNENLIPFGSKDDPKAIRGEVCSRVVLEQSAVKQVLDGINYLPKYGKLFPFGTRFIEHYVNEYTLQYIEEQAMLGKEDKRKFTYTYYDRFKRYPASNGKTIDQVDALRENLKKQIENNIFSNRHQMITWVPEIDTFSTEPPCLQRVWISLIENNSIEVHLDWRSRDLYGAWHVNLVAIINMINRDIAKPNNCEIVRIIDSCDSLHIYNGDFDQAKLSVESFI